MNRRSFLKFLGLASASVILPASQSGQAPEGVVEGYILEWGQPGLYGENLTPSSFDGLDHIIKPGWAPKSSYLEWLNSIDLNAASYSSLTDEELE